MSPFLHGSVALLCMLLCAGECQFYCIVPLHDTVCPCQDSCLTLSEISTNTSYYLDSNTTLILQPGNHNLNSNLTVFNISAFKLHSSEPSTTRVTCKQYASFHFFEVITIEITGLEFVECGVSSVIRTDTFALRDSILISENDTGTVLVLNETVTANVVNCSFVGVGMSIVQQSFVTVDNISMSDNRANLAALTVYNSYVEFIGSTKLMNNQGALLAYNATVEFIGNTVISNCTSMNKDSLVNLPFVEEGGAVRSYLSHLTFQGNTTFTNNRAKYGGAMYAVESFILFMITNSRVPDLTGSEPGTSTVIAIQNNTATRSGGGMYIYRSTVVIRHNNYQITANVAYEKGGGIYLAHSDIKLEVDKDKTGSLSLARNSARLGGGFYLEGISRLQVYAPNGSIKLTENYADYGAAIFVDDNTKYGTCLTTPVSSTPESECFFGVYIPCMYSPASTTVQVETITAWNNTARYSGSNLFGGLIDRCTPSSVGNAISTGAVSEQYSDGQAYLLSISSLFGSNANSITSHPVKVCFCTQNNMPNCSFRSLTKEVQKGQPFNVSVVAVDQIRTPVRAQVLASLSPIKGSLGEGKSTHLANSCTDISYSVFSSDESETLYLYAEGPCRDVEPSRLAVTVEFLPCSCPVGFQLNATNNGTSCECICDPLIYPEYISSCSIPLIERKTNSWITAATDDETNETFYMVGRICPFRYCLGQTYINLNTQEGIALQCVAGRNGTLCVTCSANYSYAVSGKRCVKCPEVWPLLFVVIVLGALLAGLGLVISIMVMNFTVAVGTINGFIFYANIIDVYDMVFLPFNEPNFPELLTEWLNLDPGIDVCFAPSYGANHLMWIRLLFPLYIIFIVIVIIVISERSVRFSTLIGKRNPIAVLATLILLSYANFLETALLILTPSTLITVTSSGTHDYIVWLLDGDIRYLDRTHIPLFLVTLLILFFAIIYKLIIFSWQWVVRCPKVWILKWTSNHKLNSFIQAYQAPYNDRHRYWTGLLLLVRVMLTLILSFTASTDPNSSVIAMILSLGILFLLRLTYAKNLYKKWPVDLLETVLIFNLFALATLAYTYNDDNSRRILAYISVSFTAVLLLVVLGYHAYTYILIDIFPNLKKRTYTLTRSNTRQDGTARPTLDTTFYNQDRFLENVGSSEPPNLNASKESTSLNPTRKAKHKMPQVVTHSVISFSDFSDQCQPELPVVTEESNFEAPYEGIKELNT